MSEGAGAPAWTPARVADDDLEDVRIAVVMSGGVSLAVWIGGVAREMNLLTEASPDAGGGPYAALLDVTQSTARVDVISGTSAGGINGAFLALGSVYGADLGPLGKLWADKGALGRLLRSPMQADPPSLLRGDDYFLPELLAAVSTLHPGSDRNYRSPQDRPVDLIMTTAVLTGEHRTFTDRFGNPIHEVDHLGLFRFRRHERTAPGWADGAGDPFRSPTITSELALAARSTASFPFAFEASYIPVGPDGTSRLRPDMTRVANFSQSRFVIDGGVLVNRPVGLALQAIFEQPADRQVRRLLAYVDPDPSGSPPGGPDDPEAPPTIRQVLVDSLLTLPRAQSISNELAELERHNEQVGERRRLRIGLDGARLGLAGDLYGAYRRRRVERAVDHVLGIGRVVGVFGTAEPGTRVPRWSAQEFRAAFEAVAGVSGTEPGQVGQPAGVPFLPTSAGLAAAIPTRADDWTWGLAPAERLLAVAIDVHKRALWVAPMDDHELRRRLRDQRRRLYTRVTPLRDARDLETACWRTLLEVMPEPPTDSAQRNEHLRAWLADVVARWPVAALPGDHPAPHGAHDPAAELRADQRYALEETIWTLVALMADSRESLHRAAEAGARSPIPTIREEAGALLHLIHVVYGRDDEPLTTEPLMERLLRLEVLHLMLAPHIDVEQTVDLMHISAHTGNSFGGPDRPDTKLAGVRLGHFGAFYKTSWRVNDWIWGRLDGATRLCQLLLSPDRLRQLGHNQQSALDAVRDAALGPEPGPDASARAAADRTWLASQFDAAACGDELRYLDDPDLPVPPSLPVCAMMIARRQHLAILRQELPELVAAVDVDEHHGANRISEGARLRGRYQAATSDDGELPADLVVDLFRDSRIGQETIVDDAGSDLFAATVSQASLVTVSALDAKRSGLGPARIITRSLRGLMLVLYALVAGAVRSGRFGRQAVAIALAAGGALLAVALLAEDVPDPVVSIGAVLVIAGIGLSALRARMWQFVVLLALPLAVVVLLLVTTTTWEDLAPHLGTITIVAVLVVASLGVGSLRTPERPPWPVRGSRRRQLGLLVGSLVVTAVLAVWVLAVQPDPSILEFQRMTTVERARSIVGRWGADGIATARTNTFIDVGFLLVYWLPFAAAGSLLADGLRRWGRDPRSLRTARAVSLAGHVAIAMAVFDLVENLLMLSVLQTAQATAGSLASLPAVVPAAVTVAAAAKFLLLAVAIGLVVAGAVALVAVRRSDRPG